MPKTLTVHLSDDLLARLERIQDNQGSWERGLLVSLRKVAPTVAPDLLDRHGRGDGGLNGPEMLRLVVEMGLLGLETLHAVAGREGLAMAMAAEGAKHLGALTRETPMPASETPSAESAPEPTPAPAEPPAELDPSPVSPPLAEPDPAPAEPAAGRKSDQRKPGR